MLRTSFHPTIAHLGLAPVSSLLDPVIVIPLAACFSGHWRAAIPGTRIEAIKKAPALGATPGLSLL
jgi:hypothetical protein